jgi:hypothetical protein
LLALGGGIGHQIGKHRLRYPAAVGSFLGILGMASFWMREKISILLHVVFFLQ